MTKKDYELIAGAIRQTIGLQEQDTNKIRFELFAEYMASEFEAHNPKFNRCKFLQACGLGEAVKEA